MTPVDELAENLEYTAEVLRRHHRSGRDHFSGEEIAFHLDNLAEAVAAISGFAAPRVIPYSELRAGGLWDFGYLEARDAADLIPVILKPRARAYAHVLSEFVLDLGTEDRYERENRVWTARPSEAKRKETPWKDAPARTP